MATPEQVALQAMTAMFAKQMTDFTTNMAKQQQEMMNTMIQQVQSSQAASSGDSNKPIDDRHFKKIENFTGEGSWRDWAFQFKAATKMADAKTYDLIEWAEKEQTEIDDELDLTDETRKRNAGIFNILGTIAKREFLQVLRNSNLSGAEARRKLAKRFSPTTPMRGMQLCWEGAWNM